MLKILWDTHVTSKLLLFGATTNNMFLLGFLTFGAIGDFLLFGSDISTITILLLFENWCVRFLISIIYWFLGFLLLGTINQCLGFFVLGITSSSLGFPLFGDTINWYSLGFPLSGTTINWSLGGILDVTSYQRLIFINTPIHWGKVVEFHSPLSSSPLLHFYFLSISQTLTLTSEREAVTASDVPLVVLHIFASSS